MQYDLEQFVDELPDYGRALVWITVAGSILEVTA